MLLYDNNCLNRLLYAIIRLAYTISPHILSKQCVLQSIYIYANTIVKANNVSTSNVMKIKFAILRIKFKYIFKYTNYLHFINPLCKRDLYGGDRG